MVAEQNRIGVAPVPPAELHLARRMPELSEIPPEVVQECLGLEREIKTIEQWSMRTAALSLAAIAGSRLTHRYATGQWGEGLGHAHLRTLKEWLLPVPMSQDQQPPLDWGTVALTGVAGFALGASVVLGSGQASLQGIYDKKCEDFHWARIGAGEAAFSRYLSDQFAALDPVSLPQSTMVTDAAIVDYVRRPSSPNWLDGAHRFARQNPNAAAGVMALAVVAAGAAIYLSGGTVLVVAAL